jgi:hypothetical protein
VGQLRDPSGREGTVEDSDHLDPGRSVVSLGELVEKMLNAFWEEAVDAHERAISMPSGGRVDVPYEAAHLGDGIWVPYEHVQDELASVAPISPPQCGCHLRFGPRCGGRAGQLDREDAARGVGPVTNRSPIHGTLPPTTRSNGDEPKSSFA